MIIMTFKLCLLGLNESSHPASLHCSKQTVSSSGTTSKSESLMLVSGWSSGCVSLLERILMGIGKLEVKTSGHLRQVF
jgi:hypothetical protein